MPRPPAPCSLLLALLSAPYPVPPAPAPAPCPLPCFWSRYWTVSWRFCARPSQLWPVWPPGRSRGWWPTARWAVWPGTVLYWTVLYCIILLYTVLCSVMPANALFIAHCTIYSVYCRCPPSLGSSQSTSSGRSSTGDSFWIVLMATSIVIRNVPVWMENNKKSRV